MFRVCSKGHTVVEEVVLVGSSEHCDDEVFGLRQDDAANTTKTVQEEGSKPQTDPKKPYPGFRLLKRLSAHVLVAALVPLLRRG